MTIAQMLEQSGILTLLGMCVVFAFLIIMIGAMNLLHGVIHLFGWDKAEPPAASAASAASGIAPAASQADNGAIVAAIAAAIHEKEA
ncbi:MAG: OadG family protein [Treponema sp.]|nr:OadG family protein [Treponema sp.]